MAKQLKDKPTNCWDVLNNILGGLFGIIVMLLFTPLGWFGAIILIMLYQLATGELK